MSKYGKVHYSFICVDDNELSEVVSSLNRYQDKIVAVTQSGNTYTIFYEDGGNEEDTE